MSIPNTVKIFNTGEIIKNEFYILNTPGKNLQNSEYKERKIQDFTVFYNIIMSDTLPNFIKTTLNFKVIDVEALLENYRQNNFPDYPSRLACFFVFNNIEDIKKYKEDSPQTKDNPVYKVQITSNNYKITKHNMEYVSVLRTTRNFKMFKPIIEKENILHKYWSGEASDFDYSKYDSPIGIIKPLFEFLIEGEYSCTLVSN